MPTSLASVVVGLALLVIMASLVVPSAASSQMQQLEASGVELQSLVGVAYRESVRTGQPHAVKYSAIDRRFEVFLADVSVEPPANIGDVYHPATRLPVALTLNDNITFGPSSTPFNFGAGGATDTLLFDNWGTPFYITGGVPFGLAAANLELTQDSYTVTVAVEPFTGRVTLQ